ncbi:hypothetical protein GCM10025873_02470 [Demequina sediminis]|uniref:hypothetical protein n=1 Tax=Demequina sediminis TaxID=1930058 RepID=UPI002573B7D9|nr:hypothetical protein [Demequina sediminis]BDZ60456.1 hypothetical protein GCM10025873_02470 [Demequina sediminis]
MSIDWSLLVPGLIIAVVTGASVGGYLDLSRRVEERRHARRRFTREAPVAVSAAHELLIAGIAKDPTSLVPPAEFANALREQAARLQGGTRRQMAALPAIDMVREMDRALEDLAVRGRALDLRLEHAMAAAPQTLEHKLVLKLAKQAIQKDPTPADAIPRIDNAEAHAAMMGDPAVVADIIRYRRAQQLLHDARDAFVDHWWTVRDLRLSAETRLATSRHEGGEVAAPRRPSRGGRRCHGGRLPAQLGAHRPRDLACRGGRAPRSGRRARTRGTRDGAAGSRGQAGAHPALARSRPSTA